MRKGMKITLTFPFLLLILVAVAQIASAADKRPNVLFLFSDDHAPHAIGAYDGWLKSVNPTPNIDRLAAEGMLFGADTARVAVNPRAALSEEDEQMLRLLVESNEFTYYGAIAFAPGDGIVSPSLQGFVRQRWAQIPAAPCDYLLLFAASPGLSRHSVGYQTTVSCHFLHHLTRSARWLGV